MRKLIFITLMAVRPLPQAKEVTVYLNVIPLMSKIMYMFTEAIGNGIGQSSDWDVQLAYQLDGDHALSAGYYGGGTLASISSHKPAYTLS